MVLNVMVASFFSVGDAGGLFQEAALTDPGKILLMLHPLGYSQ